jgi:hypothetical protein
MVNKCKGKQQVRRTIQDKMSLNEVVIAAVLLICGVAFVAFPPKPAPAHSDVIQIPTEANSNDTAQLATIVADQFQPQIRANNVIVIASPDSSTSSQKSADYVCDGTDDQTTAAAAFAAAKITSTTGGEVYEGLDGALRTATFESTVIVFLPGVYHFADTCTLTATHNTKILGMPGAIIQNDSTDGSDALVVDGTGKGTYGAWHVLVENLDFQGNEDSGRGLFITGCSSVTVNNCRFHNNGSHGYELSNGGTYGGDNNHIISGCRFGRNYGYGLLLTGVHETLITQCIWDAAYNWGIYLNGTTNTVISNCVLEHVDDADTEDYGELKGVDVHGITMSNTECTDIDLDIYAGSWWCNLSNVTAGRHWEFNGGSGCSLNIENGGSYDITVTGAFKRGQIGNFQAVSSNSFSSTYSGGRLSVANSYLGVTSVTWQRFRVANSTITPLPLDVDELYLNGTIAYFNGNHTIGSRMVITDSSLTFQTATTFTADTTYALWEYTDNTAMHVSTAAVTFDSNGYASGRMAVANNTVRFPNYTFEDLQGVAINGGSFWGAGSITFTNVDGGISLCGTVNNATPVTIEATCAADVAVVGNSIMDTAALSNSATGISSVGQNAASDASWNP